MAHAYFAIYNEELAIQRQKRHFLGIWNRNAELLFPFDEYAEQAYPQLRLMEHILIPAFWSV